MTYTLVLHFQNSEPVVGEVDQLPSPSDQLILVHQPRKMDGKELTYLAENVTSVYWPVDKLVFIEVLPNEEDDLIIGPVRE